MAKSKGKTLSPKYDCANDGSNNGADNGANDGANDCDSDGYRISTKAKKNSTSNDDELVLMSRKLRAHVLQPVKRNKKGVYKLENITQVGSINLDIGFLFSNAHDLFPDFSNLDVF